MIEFERTKELAKKRKMSLREVNDKANLGKNTIYNWKTKKPGSDALSEVAKVLHTSIDYLKGVTDNPSPVDDAENHSVDLADDSNIFTYEGRPIPEEDMKIIKRLLNSNNDN